MVIGDIVAIGIIVLCLVIGSTTLKLVSRLLMGVVLSIVVLTCIGLLSDNAMFDRLTHGIFRDGVVVSYVQQKTASTVQRIKGVEMQHGARFLHESRR